MNRTALCQLPALDSLPSTEVGSYLKSLYLLFDRDIPVAPLVLVTTAALLDIAKANNLQLTISKYLKETSIADSSSKKAAEERLMHIFKRLQLPQALRHQLHSQYHDYLLGGFVTVYPSVMIQKPNGVLENCQGDANLIESILETWAESCFQYFTRHPHATAPELLMHTGIVVQYQPQSEFSGFAYTMNPDTGNKTSVKILGTQGVIESRTPVTHATWIVDIRTGHIVSQEHRNQKRMLIRKIDEYKNKDLDKPAEQLTANQVTKIAKLISHAKRQFLDHKKIYWSLERGQFICTGIEQFEFEYPKTHSAASITKLFISHPSRSEIHGKTGLHGAYISGNAIILEEGSHPLSHGAEQDSLLSHQIARYIETTAQSIAKDGQILYSLHTISSSTLKTLRNANHYEPDEVNPSLGLRGVSRYLQQRKLLTVELNAIATALKNPTVHIGLVIPFARTAAEIKLFLEVLKSHDIYNHPRCSRYALISTPSSVSFLSSFPLQQFAGVIFDMYTHHALSTGIDPENQGLLSEYPLDSSQATGAIEHIQGVLRTASQLSVLARSQQLSLLFSGPFHDHIARKALSLGATGMIVQPQVVQAAKACIIDVEGAPWRQ